MKKNKKRKTSYVGLFHTLMWGTGLLCWIYNLSLALYFIGNYFKLQGMLAAMGAK